MGNPGSNDSDLCRGNDAMNMYLSSKNHQSCRARCPFMRSHSRRLMTSVLLVFFCTLVTALPAQGGLQQVFVDGQAGRFQEARSELKRLSDELEAQATSADFVIVGRNCAAVGFYSVLDRISSDCLAGILSSDHGKQLFSAAQCAASSQIDKAALYAKDVADSNPTYPQVQLLLARFQMFDSMQNKRNYDKAIELYRTVLEMDENNAVAHLDLGMLYQHMGKHPEAITLWKAAADQPQGRAAAKWAHLMLAFLYSMEEQWTEAGEYAQKAMDMGFTGIATELLEEIAQHVNSDSISKEEESLYRSAIEEDKYSIYEHFISEYPNSTYLDEIGKKIDRFEKYKSDKIAFVTWKQLVEYFHWNGFHGYGTSSGTDGFTITIGELGNPKITEISSVGNLEFDGEAEIIQGGVELREGKLAIKEGGVQLQKGTTITYPKDYTEVIDLNPENADAYYYRGVAFANKGDYDKAVQDYTQAISVDPKYAIAYSNRGAAFFNKGDIYQAIQDFTKAASVNPADARSYNNRGVVYQKSGDIDKAIVDYTKAIDLEQKFADAYYNRGRAYNNKGDINKAIEDYTKAIDLNPKYVNAYNYRGEAFANKGDYDKAIQDFTQAISFNPKLAESYYGRGYIYHKKEHVDKAIGDFTKTIELSPNYPNAYNLRGLAFAKKGDFDRALLDISRAIAINSKEAEFYLCRAKVYFVRGDKNNALQDSKKAIELDSGYKSLVKNFFGKTKEYAEDEAFKKMMEE